MKTGMTGDGGRDVGEGERGEGTKEKGERKMEAGEGRREKGEGKQGDLNKAPIIKPGKIETFEDLRVWQQAIDLAAAVYTAFEKSRDFSLRDQVQRAVISISSNIAEGYERDSNADFIRFLYYAKGSCGEVRSQLHLAQRVKLLADQSAITMIEEARLLSRKLGAYIKVRETRF